MKYLLWQSFLPISPIEAQLTSIYQIYLILQKCFPMTNCVWLFVSSSPFLSCLLGKLPSPTYFITLSVTTTIIFQFYVFRQEILILYCQQLIVYCLCKWASRKNIGKVVLVQTFVYLIAVQLRRMYVAYGKNDVDITAVLMMQVFLYVGFAYNYQDGMNQRNNSPRKIINFPSAIEFIGYLFFLPATLVGPVFQFIDYQNYLHRKENYARLPESTWPGIKQQLKTFILTILIYVTLLKFDLEYMLTTEFSDHNILYKILYMSLAIFAFRFKYYSAWSLGMLGMNATGITFNLKKQQHGQKVTEMWDRVHVSDIWTFELDGSMKRKADAWNKSVQLALKRYIYDRIYEPTQNDTQRDKKRKQRQAQQRTLFVSAIWHGLYPGYFISFFHWALLLQISQQLFRLERTSEKFAQMRKKFRYVELIVVNFFLGYFGVCFVFMSIYKIWHFVSTMYFIPPLLVYVGNILIVRMGILSKRKGKSDEIDEKGLLINNKDIEIGKKGK